MKVRKVKNEMDRSRTSRKSWYVLIYEGDCDSENLNWICRQTETNTASIHMNVYLQVHILDRYVPNLLKIHLWFLKECAN